MVAILLVLAVQLHEDSDGDNDGGVLSNWCRPRQTMLHLRERQWHLTTHTDGLVG